MESIIDFLEIKPWRKKIVGTLPYGIRKRIELGRALAIEPRLLLLDEPMAGMNAEEKEDMARFILDVYEEKKIPTILIEHGHFADQRIARLVPVAVVVRFETVDVEQHDRQPRPLLRRLRHKLV